MPGPTDLPDDLMNNQLPGCHLSDFARLYSQMANRPMLQEEAVERIQREYWNISQPQPFEPGEVTWYGQEQRRQMERSTPIGQAIDYILSLTADDIAYLIYLLDAEIPGYTGAKNSALLKMFNELYKCLKSNCYTNALMSIKSHGLEKNQEP